MNYPPHVNPKTAFAPPAPPRKPPRILNIPQTALSDAWRQNTGPICIGLRLLSEAATENATIEAARWAVRVFTASDGQSKDVDEDTWNDCYNARIIAEAVARAICDPNDVTRPHPSFAAPEDTVPLAFTPEGLRFVWDAMCEMAAELSPLLRAADDVALERLETHLAAGTVKKLTPDDARWARKLLAAVLLRLDEASPHVASDEEEDEDDVIRIPGR